MAVNVNTRRYEALCKLRGQAVRRALPTSEALLAEAERRHAMHLLGEKSLAKKNGKR